MEANARESAQHISSRQPAGPSEKYKEHFYPEVRFGGFSDVDGTVAFYSRVSALTSRESIVVDFGCGRGQHTEDPVPFRRALRCFKGKVRKVIGLDVDLVGRVNPSLDEFRMMVKGEPWPLADRSADVVICDSVIEHLPEPGVLFREAQRVLVHGGFLCIRTTNLLGYVGLASKLVPNRHHTSVLERVQGGRTEIDVFPTLYRCNTINSIRREMKSHNFDAVVYGHTAEPSYFNFSKVAYAMGILYRKMMPTAFGLTIFAFGQSLN